MKKILDTIIITLFISSSLLADNLSESFKTGIMSGDILFYGESQNNKGNDDTGFTHGSIGLNYETASFYNFKVSLGARSNHLYSEEGTSNYGGDEPTTLLHTSNISYTNDFISVIVGRQPMEFEWAKDYQEAYIIALKPSPDFLITLGHSEQRAKAKTAEVLIDFGKINGQSGVNFLDTKYSAIHNLVLNAYFYSAADIANWYGAKVNFTTDLFGMSAHYASSNVDAKVATDDASILHFEARGNMNKLGIKVGYISNDKNTGIEGIMDIMGDSIDMFDDSDHIYGANADTLYFATTYSLGLLQLDALYGICEYGVLNNKEKELNLVADYMINKELSLSIGYIDVNAANSTDDYNRIEFSAKYSF
jgi:hypothetical protein